jgi:hypothetical protein
MADPGLELLVAARREAVVPRSWSARLAERVERGLRSLRGARLLTGGRGRAPLDIAAVAGLA